MDRINADTITLTSEEVDLISSFIWETLYREWSDYTTSFITNKPLETGMKQMNPKMYEFMEQLRSL